MKEKLCRATYDRRIFGVCGGLAHYLNMDSTVIRLLTAVLIFVGGVSLWFYLIAAFIMPVSEEY